MKFGQYQTQIKQLKADNAVATDKMKELIAARQKSEMISGTKTSSNIQINEQLEK